MRQPISRTKVIIAAAAAVWTGLLLFVGYVQLGRWKHYERQAIGQQGETLDLHPTRGRVYDAGGRPLTLNRTYCSVRILPQWARDKDTLAGILAGFGLAERRAIAQELHRRNRLFWFRRDVEYAVGDSLRRVLVERQFSNCTYVEDDHARIYPHGELCATSSDSPATTGAGRGWSSNTIRCCAGAGAGCSSRRTRSAGHSRIPAFRPGARSPASTFI